MLSYRQDIGNINDVLITKDSGLHIFVLTVYLFSLF